MKNCDQAFTMWTESIDKDGAKLVLPISEYCNVYDVLRTLESVGIVVSRATPYGWAKPRKYLMEQKDALNVLEQKEGLRFNEFNLFPLICIKRT